MKINFQTHLDRQRTYFHSGVTRPLSFRKKALKKLNASIDRYSAEITQALYDDLHKSSFEALATEIGYVRKEIKDMIFNMESWTAAEKVATPIHITGPGSSKIITEPLGVSLIIAPWNYPFQLVMAPLVGAIAAGNVVTVKPSELSPATEKVVAKIIREAFDESHVAVVTGGIEVSKALLEIPWNHIFFTGSTKVGKIVMKAAADHLIPVTLELGGKSPTYIDQKANLKLAAKRVAWGKFINAGQTCIAPDYVLIHRSHCREFVKLLEKYIEDFFGSDPKKSSDYGRIISNHHFDRISAMLPNKAKCDPANRYIPPSPIIIEAADHPSMEEEIFGPVLPIIPVSDADEAIYFINARPKPLAMYIFTNKNSVKRRFENETSSGGLVFNDVIMHLANSELPFGGVGESGMGNYHGKFSIDCFSHKKSVYSSNTLIDIPLRYPPYKKWTEKLLNWIF
ncbi:MAG: aldehyde dehydrogenase [Cryomorphaceae bacterium]|nr:aldehyde dehydrogenase [Cryomorphaceae bacterium]